MALTRPKSLKELALEHLRESIINGTLPMGEALSERKISENLGISKSPTREALSQLRDEGLVTIEPQKGARVFTLSESEVAQICDFRQAIETAAFELALERNADALSEELEQVVQDMEAAQQRGNSKRYLQLDTTFHQVIFKHAANDYLAASYERYLGKIAALRTHLSVLPQHTDLSFQEHKDLAAAARSKDMARIRSLLCDHIDRTRQVYAKSSNGK